MIKPEALTPQNIDEIYNDITHDGKDRFYFKHRNDFLSQPALCEMREMPGGNGAWCCYVFMRICEASVKASGIIQILRTEIGFIPALARIVGESNEMNIVATTVNFAIKKELLKIIETEKYVYIIIPCVCKDHERTTKAAERKKEKRQLLREQEKQKLEVDTKLLDNKSDKKVFGRNKNVYLTESEYKTLCADYENADFIIDRLSLYRSARNIAYGGDDYSYLLLSFVDKHGVKRIKKDKSILIRQREREAKVGCPPTEADIEIIGEDEYNRLKNIAAEVEKKIMKR